VIDQLGLDKVTTHNYHVEYRKIAKVLGMPQPAFGSTKKKDRHHDLILLLVPEFGYRQTALLLGKDKGTVRNYAIRQGVFAPTGRGRHHPPFRNSWRDYI